MVLLLVVLLGVRGVFGRGVEDFGFDVRGEVEAEAVGRGERVGIWERVCLGVDGFGFG
jgi:hypothetical protein